MSWWGRVMHAARAAWSAYNERSLVPSDEYGWDEYQARLFRYHFAASYYNNTVYSDIERAAAMHKFKAGLYTHTRGIYNPVQRLVDLYVAKIYGGKIDYEFFRDGALPLEQADEPLLEPLRQLLKWSNWGTEKSLYVRYGAMLGDVALKVIDDRESGKVRLEVLHPAKIKAVNLDAVGNVKAVVIEYDCYEDEDINAVARRGYSGSRKTYTYTEVIDDQTFRTYKNGELFGFYKDANGQPIAEWDNEYGFVPLVLAQHKNLGLMWGASAYHGSLRKIDEINDQASNLNDQIRKMVNAIWYFAGARQADEITASTENKDAIPALYGPEGSQPFPMVAPLNIADASANVMNLLAELERDMPELSLHRLREATNQTAPGIRAAYSDAIDRFIEASGNYDDALVRAMQMAVSIGGYNRYDGFGSYNLESYSRGDLAFFIGQRAVIQDELSRMERLGVLRDANSTIRLRLEELGYQEKVIQREEAEQDRQARNAARGFAEGVFGEDEDTDDGDNAEEDDTEQDREADEEEA